MKTRPKDKEAAVLDAQVAFRVESDLKEELERRAARAQRKLSDYLRVLVAEAIRWRLAPSLRGGRA